ncbi:FkbM family methyltransferase [Novosphingobium rosa]|uniref:FkbM family methyltransferase n=1 Tax=Novosphingobium rosa TaxID=76978 RepID=UPI001470E69E|nr:FkbM family methyltransferase [Novosphingobium rosa]
MNFVSFSQNFEDVMLWRALGDVREGFFIDVGANDPVKDSISRLFSNHGWRGIHVEPVPYYADLLRKSYPNDLVIQAVISETEGVVDFYNIDGTGLSTAKLDIAKGHEENKWPVVASKVSAMTMDKLLEMCGESDVHWLKVDVEGYEYEVLSGWRNSCKRPWVIVMESTIPCTQDSNYSEWENFLLDKGYFYVYGDGLNRFYLHHDRKHLAGKFDSPPNVFDNFQLDRTSGYVKNLVEDFNSEITSLIDLKGRKISELELDVNSLKSQISALKNSFDEKSKDFLRKEALSTSSFLERERELCDLIVNLRAINDKNFSEFRSREKLLNISHKSRINNLIENQNKMISSMRREKEKNSFMLNVVHEMGDSRIWRAAVFLSKLFSSDLLGKGLEALKKGLAGDKAVFERDTGVH